MKIKQDYSKDIILLFNVLKTIEYIDFTLKNTKKDNYSDNVISFIILTRQIIRANLEQLSRKFTEKNTLVQYRSKNLNYGLE